MDAQIQGTLTILRRKQVQARTGLPRSTLYDLIRTGSFPAPIALGARSVGWNSAAVEGWIADRLKNGATEREARRPKPNRKTA